MCIYIYIYIYVLFKQIKNSMQMIQQSYQRGRPRDGPAGMPERGGRALPLARHNDNNNNDNNNDNTNNDNSNNDNDDDDYYFYYLSHTDRMKVVECFIGMDTLGIEPRASRMLSGCDKTTPCAPCYHYYY